MRTPRPLLLLASLLLVAAAADGGEIRLDPRLGSGGVADLADAIGDALSFAPVGPGAPLGVTGFDLLVVAGGPQVDEDASWWRYAGLGETTGGVAVVPRAVLRKGLPARLDVGAHVGEAFGERFWGAELRWALLGGGVLEPALGLRVSHTRLIDAPIDLDASEAGLVLSKRFAVLAPYAMVGYRRVTADAVLATEVPLALALEQERMLYAVGLKAGVTPLRLVAEARQGWKRSFFVGVGIGL